MNGVALVLDDSLPLAGMATEPESRTTADRTLAARFAAGDEAAFNELVSTRRERVTRLARRMLGWPDEVDDIVQEVFLAAYQSLGRYRGEATIDTWLTTITLNKCRSARRKQFLRLRLLQRMFRREAVSVTAAQPVQANERMAAVRCAIGRLAMRDREIIVLRCLEDQSIETIASVLGITRGAVEVRLSRARERLRALLPPQSEL